MAKLVPLVAAAGGNTTAWTKLVRKVSKPPKSVSICAANFPGALPPPFGVIGFLLDRVMATLQQLFTFGENKI